MTGSLGRAWAAALCGCALLGAGCGKANLSAAGAPQAPSVRSTSSGSTGLQPTGTPQYVSPSPGARVQSGVVQIAFRNITIEPDAIRVRVGSTIRWTSYDPVEHNVTSEGGPQRFASRDFGQGQTFEIRANRPGVIRYQCTIHPASMNGTIEVLK